MSVRKFSEGTQYASTDVSDDAGDVATAGALRRPSAEEHAMTTMKSTPDGEADDRIEFTITVRSSQIAALAAILHPPPASPTPSPPAAPSLVTKQELARTLSVSVTTIDRLVHDGMPHEAVGSVRRFDLDACRTWLKTRGKKATTPAAKPPEEDSIDISRAVRRAGLRAVGGRKP